MTTLQPLSALGQSLEHAHVHALPAVVTESDAFGRARKTRPTVPEDFTVYAMFLQPATSAALERGLTHTYTVVLRCEAAGAWLAYFDGEYGWRLDQDEADIGNFMRDLRTQRLLPAAHAPEAYGARL